MSPVAARSRTSSGTRRSTTRSPAFPKRPRSSIGCQPPLPPASHHALTGLSNRALFLDRVEHALARIRRSDSPIPAVAFIDLDDFKLVNDSLGHGAGDERPRAAPARPRACLRSGDPPARLGGDEFAVLLEDAPDTRAV